MRTLTYEEATDQASVVFKDAAQGDVIKVSFGGDEDAAVVAFDRLEQLEELRCDLLDAVLALSRVLTDSGRRTPLDQVIATLGISNEELDTLPDD